MRRLNITATILDKLGFSEYWDEHGTWGGRTLTFSNGERFRIIEQEEMDDDTEGYSDDGAYVSNHYYFTGWFALPATKSIHYDLFFLHEMYECVEKNYPNCVEEFIQKCRSLKMGKYIDDFLQSRSIISELEKLKKG